MWADCSPVCFLNVKPGGTENSDWASKGQAALLHGSWQLVMNLQANEYVFVLLWCGEKRPDVGTSRCETESVVFSVIYKGQMTIINWIFDLWRWDSRNVGHKSSRNMATYYGRLKTSTLPQPTLKILRNWWSWELGKIFIRCYGKYVVDTVK
jgi:hypothetical protein